MPCFASSRPVWNPTSSARGSEPLTEDGAWQALDRAVPRLDRYVADHSIEVLNARDVYLAEGEIDRHRIIGNWKEKLQGAISRRYQGIRVSGNTAWVSQKQWRDFMDYETELNRGIGNQPMLVLCTYPLTANAATDDVVRTHQFAVAKRRGRWAAVQTPEHRTPIVGATAEYVRRPPRRSSRMGTLGVVGAAIKSTLAGLAAYAAGRCSGCGRGFVAGAPLRWCVNGHKIHHACVKSAMEREVCPICGIYVSDSPPRASRG